MTPYPLKDWLLSAVVELDLISPGVAGHVARASPERRQVIAALMSVTPNASFTKELGVAVQTARHDDLINVAFGTNPPGFRTALAKVGAHPQPRRFYQYLFRILTAQSRYDSAVVIRLLPRVTYPRLQVLRALPSDLRSPQLIESLTDEQQARDLAAIVALFTERGADRDQMCRSLAKVESPSAIREFARRWVLRANMPVHPVAASEMYRPICSGGELAAMARQFRNCARTYICRLLEGKTAMAEFRHPIASAIVHLELVEDQWRLEQIYGHRNRNPNGEVKKAALAYLQSQGVAAKENFRSTSPWESLRRIGGHFDFEE